MFLTVTEYGASTGAAAEIPGRRLFDREMRLVQSLAQVITSEIESLGQSDLRAHLIIQVADG